MNVIRTDEVKILITLKVEHDEADSGLSPDVVGESARLAVQNAIDFANQQGFVHTLAEKTSIGVAAVEVV